MPYNMEMIHEYRDAGVSVIPVKGKLPSIQGWQQYCTRWPTEEEIDSWENVSYMTGFAIPLGPASNLCAIDVDEENPERLQKLLDALPYSPVRKVGKKGETRFYRLYDEIEDYHPYFKAKEAINNQDGKRAVDMFFETGYTVIPPSAHPDGGNYVWTGEPLTPDYDKDELPVLNVEEAVAIVKSICGGHDVKKNLPVNGDSGRFTQMGTYVAKLIRQKVPYDVAVDQLLAFDEDNFPQKRYFLDKTKGHKTMSARLNAGKYYLDNATTFASRCLDPSEIEEPSRMVGGQEVKVLQDGWETPIPIVDERLEEFDTDLVPDKWKTWILDRAESTGVAPQNILGAAFSGLSSCFGNKVFVSPKNDGEWKEPVVLWVVVIDLAGNKKSQVQSIALKAVREINKNVIEQCKKDNAKADSLNKVIQMKIKKKEKDLKDSIEAGDMDNILSRLENEVILLKEEVIKTPNRKLLINVSTPEAIINDCSDNPQGIFIVEDELSSTMDRMQKKGFENFKLLLLKGWDANSEFSYSTVSRGDITIPKLCLGFLGFSQPSIYKEYIKNVICGRDDGFIQRPLPIMSNKKIRKTVIKPVSKADEFKALEIFHKAHSLPEKDSPIPMSPSALNRMIQYLDYIDEVCNSDEQLDSVGSFYGKCRGNVIKLAFLYEFIDSEENAYPSEITLKSLEKAIEFISHVMNGVEFMFKAAKKTPFIIAKEILQRIKLKEIKTGATYKGIIKSCNDITRDREQLGHAMKILSDNNYIKVVNLGSDFEVTVNPNI